MRSKALYTQCEGICSFQVPVLGWGVSVSAILPQEQAGHGQRRWMCSDASLFFLHCAAVEAVSESWEDTCGAEIYRGEMKARFLFCCRV